MTRPFAGLGSEPDWVAMREIVPAATAPLMIAAPYEDRRVTLATLLPLAAPALVRGDGEVMLALQTQASTADPSRDLAAVLIAALATVPGGAVLAMPEPGDARLRDLLVESPLQVTMYDSFTFWPDEMALVGVSASRERADAMVVPTVRLASVQAAYWCRLPERAHLRWVLPEDEDMLLDGLARLAANNRLALGDDMRFMGSFRAHGLVVPVWDLPLDATAADCEGPAARIREQLDAVLAEPAPLTADERRAREGLRGRQLTLR